MRARLAPLIASTSIAALLLASCGGPTDTATCDAVTIDAVRAAAEGVEGYTFRIEGTDSIATTVADPAKRTIGYEYAPEPVVGEGSYRVPESGMVIISEGVLEGPPRHSSLFFPLWYPNADRLVQVDGQLWLHVMGQESYFASEGYGLSLVPNTLVPLLDGHVLALQDAAGVSGGALPGLPRRWATAQAAGECVIEVTASAEAFSPIPGWDFEFGAWITVDPGSMLPARVRVHLRTPELPDSRLPAVEYDVTYAFAYDQLPDIAEPSPVGLEPISAGGEILPSG